METLATIRAVKILGQYTTEGSAPLKVIGEDGNVYIAKSTTRQIPPIELINELLGGYFCQAWNLKVPDFILIEIDDEVVLEYTDKGNSLTGNYRSGFNNMLLFGSCEVNPTTELEIYFDIAKKDLKKFSNPTDLLKIGALDLWVGNMDRKPKNPNVLISSQHDGFNFHPIDHAALFGYQTNYRDVRSIMLNLAADSSILSSDLAKKIKSFLSKEEKEILKGAVIQGFENTIECLDFIFGQVPVEWSFSRRAKEHLKTFFSDPLRNQETLDKFLSF